MLSAGLPGESQGSDPREYGKQYEVKLRKAELASIEDYIAESKNLTILHEQVSRKAVRSHVQPNRGALRLHAMLFCSFSLPLRSASRTLRPILTMSFCMFIFIQSR